MCVLEEVNGFVGKAQPGSAMFKFGAHYGFLKGITQALGIRLRLVRPQAWQKIFGLGTAAIGGEMTIMQTGFLVAECPGFQFNSKRSLDFGVGAAAFDFLASSSELIAAAGN